MDRQTHIEISETQWPYFKHWLILIGIAEGLMLILNKSLFEIYLLIAVVFLIGFTLRVFQLYPGQGEPLILDLSAAIIAIGFAYGGQWLIDSFWRFILILCSSIMIIPHFIYIAQEK